MIYICAVAFKFDNLLSGTAHTAVTIYTSKVMFNWISNILKKRGGSIKAQSSADDILEVRNYQIERKPLLLGESCYDNLVPKHYYVDKTLLIKDLIDGEAKITLFTRPRRFGKTLNMFMLKSFFEISDKDTSYLFSDKKIWKEGNKYRQYQGKYPVIFLSFKDVKNKNWESAFSNIKLTVSTEYFRHSELENSSKLSEREKKLYSRITDGYINETECCFSLMQLSAMLDKHYGVPPVIIIDEYDTPIHQGYIYGYYDEVINFMRMFFSMALKDNVHVKFSFMTGILRIAKENIFSGLNNIIVDTVLDNRYSQYFGFTEDEVKEMAHYFLSSEKVNEIKDWYDGYRFGTTDIYNPWSVLNYFYYRCNPQAYWLNTSSNDIVNKIVDALDDSDNKMLLELLQGNTVKSTISTDFIYWSDISQIKSQPDVLYSFLLMTGYLKAVSTAQCDDGEKVCELSIPNKEIKIVYKNEIIAKRINSHNYNISTEIQDALKKGNAEALKSKLEAVLVSSVSYYDTAKESFFHGLVLGLCAVMNNYYEVSSNRESGEGRYDILLKPRSSKYPGIIIELKATDDAEKLNDAAQKALRQIESKKYYASFIDTDVKSILKYGVAFCGKRAEVEFSQTENRQDVKLPGTQLKMK